MESTQIHELKRLGSALRSAPFVCGGSVDPTVRGSQAKGVSLCYQDPHGPLREIVFPLRDVGELDGLVQACAPATFGRGRDDVLDPTYRQAVKLECDQFVTSLDIASP